MTGIYLIAAARPDLMKLARLYHALKASDWAQPVLLHTSQFYDRKMSDASFKDLRVPEPDYLLGVGSTHAEQTGNVMTAYEKVCMENWPDWIVVVSAENLLADGVPTEKNDRIGNSTIDSGSLQE